MFGGRPEEKLEPTPPLLEQPNPQETRMSTFQSWGLDYLWDGNAVGVVAARSPLGYPIAALPVPAREVAVRRIQPFDVSPLPVGALEYKIGTMTLGAQDVIHVKGPCAPGDVRGMGVLENHFYTLQLAQDQQRQARSTANHGVPSGVLETQLDPDDPEADEQARDMKSAWMASQSTRTIAVLSQGTAFKPLSWNPEQLQLVASRKFTLNEIELMFGLPVGWLGGTDSSRKYSNMSQDDVAFMKWSMGNHLEQFEQTLSLAFPRGTKVRANQDAVLEPDTLTRYQAHQIGIQNGFLTVDEAREYEHRPPLPEKPALPDAFDSTNGVQP
jgi:HK97 family phage portal protein